MGLDVSQGFYCAYYIIDLGPVQIALARIFTTSRDKSCGGGVSPSTKSAARLLIGHRSVMAPTKVVRRRMHLGFVSLFVSLLYRPMWQPRGSAPKGGDDEMAVSIRFSAMTRDMSRAG